MKDFISSYVDWVEKGKNGVPLTDAPRIYTTHIAYWTLSTAVRRAQYLEYGARKLYPNIWLTLIGKSSFYRKSTAMALGARLIQQIDTKAIYPNEFSLEQLLEVLTYRPQGSFVVDEFSTFYSQFGRSYMGGSGGLSLITELFDRFLPYTRSLREVEYRIENPFINFVSATTLSSLEHTIKVQDIRSGFLPRFYFVLAKSKDKDVKIPGESDTQKEKELIDFLRKVRGKAGRLFLSKEAIDIYNSFYSDTKKIYAADLRNGISPFITRLLTTCLKFAILNHIALPERETDIVGGESMQASVNITVDLMKDVRMLFTNLALTPFQELRRKVIESFKKFNEDWLSHSKLLRDVRMSASQLRMVLETLEQEGSIEIDSNQSPGAKKPTKVYKISDELKGEV